MSKKKFYITHNELNVMYFMDIKYAIFKLNNEYVCAYRPELKADGDGIYFEEWAQGHYFENKENAKSYILYKLQDYANNLMADYIDITETIKDIEKGDFIK